MDCDRHLRMIEARSSRDVSVRASSCSVACQLVVVVDVLSERLRLNEKERRMERSGMVDIMGLRNVGEMVVVKRQ